jgi:streptogramin lyase
MPPSGANSRFETRGPAPAAWVSLLALLIFIALLIPGTAAAGAVVHFPLPAGSEPEGIATGPEGNLWFAERGSNKIGRLTPSGQLTEFAVPTADSKPFQIAAGPDGNLWFTLPGAGEVGRISPAGEITRFSLGGIVGRQIALGPDGNLWAAGVAMVREEPGFGVIDRITPAGEVTAFRIPTPVEAVLPVAIASGPGGALWFAGGSAVVGRIDTDGAISELHPPLNGEHHSAAMGPDGNLWLTSSGPSPRQGSIDRLTPDGHLTAFPVPYGSRGITVGKEGNIWFTGWVGHGIGRIVPGSPGVEIRSHRVAMRPQRTRVALFCSGGSSGTACSGTIILRARLHRGSSTATVRFGAGPYRLGNDQGASPTVRLNHRKLRWLSRHRTFRLEAVVRATQGEGAIRDLELSGHFRR